MQFSSLIELWAHYNALTISGQVQTILNRTYEIVGSVSAILIAILWIPIAIGFFGPDENKRFEARVRLRNAIIGTFIYVIAVSGVLYALVYYIVTGQ